MSSSGGENSGDHTNRLILGGFSGPNRGRRSDHVQNGRNTNGGGSGSSRVHPDGAGRTGERPRRGPRARARKKTRTSPSAACPDEPVERASCPPGHRESSIVAHRRAEDSAQRSRRHRSSSSLPPSRWKPHFSSTRWLAMLSPSVSATIAATRPRAKSHRELSASVATPRP